MSPEHHIIDIIGSAVREYFNYGREVFEEKKAMLSEIVEECNLHLYVKDSTFPDFDKLKEEFWKASSNIDANALRAQALTYCGRCWFEDCLYRHCGMDDFYLRCSHCGRCVDFAEDECCPLCGCTEYMP